MKKNFCHTQILLYNLLDNDEEQEEACDWISDKNPEEINLKDLINFIKSMVSDTSYCEKCEK